MKPDDVCTNCAQKHVSFALSLMLTGSVFDFIIAASQIYLASKHYRGYDQRLSQHCRCLAHQMLIHVDDPMMFRHYVLQLMRYQQDGTLMSPPPWQLGSDYGIDLRSRTAALRTYTLMLAQAYSLLFT